MMKVLIIEDSSIKYGRIRKVLIDGGVAPDDIAHEISAATALDRLRRQQFDLMLLDVNIPKRLGEDAVRGGGLMVLREIARNEEYRKPIYVVGITAYEDVVSEFGDSFEEYLWSLIKYSDASDEWIAKVKAKVEYITAAKKSINFSDGVTFGYDVAIICALDTVEWDGIRGLRCEWQPLRLQHDETRYLTGFMRADDGRVLTVIAAPVGRMGMPASAVLAAKMIAQFRPRLLAMSGICAGRSGKVNIGDIIVADPTWDWGSGKIETGGEGPRFVPSAHQLDVSVDIVAKLKDLGDDVELLAQLKRNATGNKPPTELAVRIGPMASGASVVANHDTFQQLVSRQRDVLAIDMEAYAVAAASLGMGMPRPKHLIVKAVCDYADENKGDDFQLYAASVSALFLQRAVARIL